MPVSVCYLVLLATKRIHFALITVAFFSALQPIFDNEEDKATGNRTIAAIKTMLLNMKLETLHFCEMWLLCKTAQIEHFYTEFHSI